MPTNPLKSICSIDPVFMDHIKATNEMLYTDGALPKKFKYLMAMAFDAVHGAIPGVHFLARQAVNCGATKEEIAEALRMAYHFGGIGAVYIGSQGLDGIFEENQK
jgi:alkylhydroperoxidase/carboxymuconolactone decarboxylase family protein YurZ